ncbi:MAG: hypothetical protein IPN38_16135 [Flavobacteriales bacterium]|nr:hypothetical protein [Flavobacteriales bacterium]
MSRSALTASFKEAIGSERCRIVFDLLIASLNSTYRAGYRTEHPKSLDEWLNLFRAAEYDLPFTDPLLKCLGLVRTGAELSLGLEIIAKMNATLRSLLLGAFAYQLDVPAKEMDRFLADENELAFVAACLIDKDVPKDPCPEWLDKSLINKILFEHWHNIGAPFLHHTYGLSYRNTAEDPFYDTIRTLLHECLYERIHGDPNKASAWFNEVHFPDDFISTFSWISDKKVDLADIPRTSIAIILDRFVIELRRLVTEIPASFVDSSDQLKTFQLHEWKYLNALAHLHYLSVHFSEENQKILKRICFELKLYYYGGYSAVLTATRYTEILLLVCLPIAEDDFPTDYDDEALKTLLKILSDTLLVSYFHVSERQEDLWNPQVEIGPTYSNFTRARIHKIIDKLNPDLLNQRYASISDCRKQVCVLALPSSMRTTQNET